MVAGFKRTSIGTPRSHDGHDSQGGVVDAWEHLEQPRPKFSRRSLEGLQQDSGEAPLTAGSACMQLVDPALECSVALVPKVAAALDKLLETMESAAESSQARVSPFHGQRTPPISLEDYLQRIAHYTKCSPACFVAAIAYIDAIYQRDHSLAPCPLSIHRLMLVGALLATKLLDDKRHSNAFWARVGGISLQDINSLELHMMHLLDHHLLVTPEVLRRYIRQLQVGTLVLGYESMWDAVGRKRRSGGGTITGGCNSSGGGNSSGAVSEGRKSSRRDFSAGHASGPDCSMGSVGRVSSGLTGGRGGTSSGGGPSRSGGPSRQGSLGSVGLMRQGSLGPENSMGSVGIGGERSGGEDRDGDEEMGEGAEQEVQGGGATVSEGGMAQRGRGAVRALGPPTRRSAVSTSGISGLLSRLPEASLLQQHPEGEGEAGDAAGPSGAEAGGASIEGGAGLPRGLRSVSMSGPRTAPAAGGSARSVSRAGRRRVSWADNAKARGNSSAMEH